jgi:hypothetical protein
MKNDRIIKVEINNMKTENINQLEELIADYQQATRGQVAMKKFTYDLINLIIIITMR